MSNAQATLAFVGGSTGIWIEFNERAVPNSELAWDRDAIRAVVRVQADPFHGVFTMLVWSHELLNLQHQFDLLWQCFGQPTQAQFRFREALLDLRVAVTRSGTVQLEVEAYNDPVATTSLRFVIEAEYMALQTWRMEIGNVLEKFPPEAASHPVNPIGIDRCRTIASPRS